MMTPDEFKASARIMRLWLINAALIILFSLSTCLSQAKGPSNELISATLEPSNSNLKVSRNLNFDAKLLEQADDKIKTLDHLEKTDLLEADVQPKSRGLLSRVEGIANYAIAPAQNYYDLVRRYRNWRTEYNQLQKQFGNKPNGEPKLRNAVDTLRLEYAKVDQMLVGEVCSSMGSPGHEKSAKQNGNMDLIVKILTLLIDRLEKDLTHYKTHGLDSSEQTAEEDQEGEEKIKEIESRVQNAMARAKSIASGSVFNLAKRELFAIAKLIVLDTIATQVVNTANNGDQDGLSGLMSRIAPFVLLIGSVNTPLLVSYLRNVQFRSAINIVCYSYRVFTYKRSPTQRPGKTFTSS